MKMHLKLSSLVLLTGLSLISSQGAQTNLVQNLAFKLTAWSQGKTTTNGSTVTVKANSQSIVTKDVLTWLGVATTNNFATSQLLVINRLGVPGSISRMVVRTKIGNITNNVDVSAFFGIIANAPTVNSYSYSLANNTINPGNYYGYFGVYLLENPSCPLLPVFFGLNGFGVDSVINVLSTKKVIVGQAEQFSVTNAVGIGHMNGQPFIITGNVSITGNTLETHP